MFKYIVALGIIFSGVQAWADDCLSFKNTQTVNISKPDINVSIIQPQEEMELAHHGHVIASLFQEIGVVAEAVFIKTGFCVSIKSIDVKYGYNDFLVHIDKSYKKNSCAFNAVLDHEQKHIDTYLSVIDEFKQEIEETFSVAADSVMPVFIEKKSDFNTAVEALHQELQSHPDLILMTQKIKAAEEIRNKKIDQIEDGADLMKCFE